MMTPQTIRRMLEGADVGRDPYGVAQGARLLLAADASDAFAFEQYVKALQVLKLSNAAARLTGAPISPGGGAIPWTSRARRFAANLKALELRTASGAALVQSASQTLARYELHQAADGNFQVLDREVPITTDAAWLGGLANHKAATSLWQFDKKVTPVPHPVAFDGIGYGWLLSHILETTANSYLNYSCAVYLLESDPLALAMLLHMHDLTAIIASPRMRWLIGERPEQVLGDFRAALEENTRWTIPERYIRCALRPRPWLELEAAIKDLVAGREKQRALLRSQIESHYSDKSPSSWATRFHEAQCQGKNLRVLGITSRFTTVLQHSMNELAQAANAAGNSVMEVAIEPDDHSLENPFLEKIAALKPDLIVQLSRMRYENPHLPRNVPFLTWDQDNLPCMRTKEATASLDALTYVAGHGAVFGYGNLHWPRRNVIFCHPAAATHRYHAGPVSADLLAKHACDISYVSNASGTLESFQENLRRPWLATSHHLQLFDALLAQVLARIDNGDTFEYITLRQLVMTAAQHRDLALDARTIQELAMALVSFADRAFRHTALHWVSRWCDSNGKRFRLYGNGWETHPQFARYAAGPAQPGEEARSVFQASRINLQLMQGGFIHSRSLDGLAAGGFFLSRYSLSDGLDSTDVATLYRLALRVRAENIRTEKELLARTEPDIRADVATVRAYYHRVGVTEEICPSLHVWADTPAAAMILPWLDKITFRNEVEFGTLANRYLSDDVLRTTLAAEMRSTIENEFSYSARWRTFLTGVHAGLQSFAAETLAAPAGVPA